MPESQPPSPNVLLWDRVEPLLCPDRMSRYLIRKDGDDRSAALARYIWNTALCEALYPSLNALEISFRNSMNNALVREKGTDEWYDLPNLLREQAVHDVFEARKRARVQKGSKQVIRELTFGFWTTLLNSKYDQSIAIGCLDRAFPYLPKAQRQRRFVSRRFEQIRRLRNDVFHHADIWYWQDLTQQWKDIYEAIGWIDPLFAELSRRSDRFGAVQGKGWKPYQRLVQDFAGDRFTG
jgi:hypothetical protein